jgi:hypothetical protein
MVAAVREERLGFRRRDAHAVFAGALVLACGAAFCGPALGATEGDWPVPLDDTFIHFDFARATAALRPFEWIAGQGYSSGETSLLYPFLLAPGYLLGFRGLLLGLWAALLAAGALFVTMRAMRELLSPCAEWVSWLSSGMLVSVGVLDWTWWSGMEGAVFVAALSVTLVRAKRAREAPPTTRRRAQWIVGCWGAAMVGLRPEAVVVVALVAVVVARRALSQSAIAALARCGGPGALAILAVLFMNLLLTGDAPSAGAIAKLVMFRPFLSDVDRVTTVLVNLVHFGLLLAKELGRGTAFALLLPSLFVPAILSRRTRALAFVCLAGALSWSILVSSNIAARFQDFRYYVPAVALMLLAAALGLGVLSRSKRLGVVGGAVALSGVLLAASAVPAQMRFFVLASKNIHDQQVEVGRRLASRLPDGATVLVGDAGAIPYVSGHPAIDALGLGGYAGLPFARAAALGEGATIELIERIAPRERPAFMALYPTWFGDITSTFGREIDRVSLDRNVICGALTKGIYEADWSALADGPTTLPDAGGDVVDALDLADVVSEREHAYVSPEPAGGSITLDVRRDARGDRRFDAGRVILEGQSQRFTLRRDAPMPVAVWIRTDEIDADVEARATRQGEVVDASVLERSNPATHAAWATSRAVFTRALRRGDEVTLRVLGGTFRAYHVWVVSGG